MALVVTVGGAIQTVTDWRGSVGAFPYYVQQSGEVGVVDIRFPPGHILRYGGIGDGNSANATTNSNAIDNMIASAIPGTGTSFVATTFARWPIRFSRGLYKIARPIVIPECMGFTMVGEGTHGGQALSAIQWAGADLSDGWMLDIESVLGMVMRDMSFIGVADQSTAGSANRIGNGIRAGRIGSTHAFCSWMEWRNISVAFFTGVGLQLGRYAGWNGTTYPADEGQVDNSSFRDLFIWNCRTGLLLQSPNFVQCIFDGLRIGNYGGNPVNGSNQPVESVNAAPTRYRTKCAIRIAYGQLIVRGAALYAAFDDGTPQAQYAIWASDGSFQILSGYSEGRYIAYVDNGADALGGTTAIGSNVIQNFHLNPSEAGGPINTAKFPIYYAQTKVGLRLDNCDNLWVMESASSAGVTAQGCRNEIPYFALTDVALMSRNSKSVEINCAVMTSSGTLRYKPGTQLGAGLGIASEVHSEFMFATDLVARQESTGTTYEFQARATGNTTARGLVVDADGLTFFVATGLASGATYTRAQLGGAVYKIDPSGNVVRYAKATAVQTVGVLYLAETHDTLLGDASSGVVFFELPLASGLRGKQYTFVKQDSGSNNVVIEAASGNTIGGAASIVLSTQWKARTLQSDGVSTWLIIGGHL